MILFPSRIFISTALVLCFLAQSSASGLQARSEEPINHLLKRTSPTGNYAPANVTCPNGLQLVRNGLSISTNESDYLNRRQNYTTPALRAFLETANLTGTDLETIFKNSSTMPRLSTAFSGGGYRAMLNGAGILAAMDNRTMAPNMTLGGLLEAMTYMTGLSGGNWLLGSVAINNFSSVDQLSADVWDLEKDILTPGGWNVFSTGSYYKDLISEVDDKRDAGFNISITDYWGRALSRQLVNATRGGPAITFADVKNETWFQDASYPFPILVSDGREPGQLPISPNTTIWEFNPYEFGTWDNGIQSFTPTEFLGTNLLNGSAPDGMCIKGFDNMGFVMGTSSSLFNAALLRVNSTGSGILRDALENILTDLSEDTDDIAIYPNPFENYTTNNFTVSTQVKNQNYLDLVDGGEDGQNIPLWPLLHPERNVDFIMAVDSSADTDLGWPNGTSMVATYDRIMDNTSSLEPHVVGFPYVPDQNTFVNEGLNLRPTFFGCDGRNTTDGNLSAPLIAYMPNSEWNFQSNTSTFKLTYSEEEESSMITNGMNAASQGNSTSWRTCLACAMIQRSVERMSLNQSQICRQCFDQYCWQGNTNTTRPTKADQVRLIQNHRQKVGVADTSGSSRGSAPWFSWILPFVVITLTMV